MVYLPLNCSVSFTTTAVFKTSPAIFFLNNQWNYIIDFQQPMKLCNFFFLSFLTPHRNNQNSFTYPYFLGCHCHFDMKRIRKNKLFSLKDGIFSFLMIYSRSLYNEKSVPKSSKVNSKMLSMISILAYHMILT